MKTSFILNVFWATLLATILNLSLPARADVDPAMLQVRDELHDALNPGGDPVSNDAKIKLLTSALELLKKSPAAYRGLRIKAMISVQAALDELGRSDPDQKADGYIRDALDTVRNITQG